MSFHENTDADCLTENKAIFTQYGVIILDSLLKADLSSAAVYKPRGPVDNQSASQIQTEKTLLSDMKYQLVMRLATVCQKGNRNKLEDGAKKTTLTDLRQPTSSPQ